MRVDIESGKYTYIFEDGRARLLRYGDPTSRDIVGDKLIYCMASEIESLRQQLAEREAEIKRLQEALCDYKWNKNEWVFIIRVMEIIEALAATKEQ